MPAEAAAVGRVLRCDTPGPPGLAGTSSEGGVKIFIASLCEAFFCREASLRRMKQSELKKSAGWLNYRQPS